MRGSLGTGSPACLQARGGASEEGMGPLGGDRIELRGVGVRGQPLATHHTLRRAAAPGEIGGVAAREDTAMWNDPAFLALAIPAVIFAGVSKGGFGSGAAFAATPLLALVVDPGTALAVMLPLLMLVDLAVLRPYWRRWSWPDARLLILGGLPGVALGAALWRVAPADAFRLLIGVLALAFVLWQARGTLAPRLVPVAAPPAPGTPPPGHGWGLLAGVVAGFTSFVSHAGGPPVAVYLLARGHPKTTYQATTVLVFWVVNLAKSAAFAGLGLFTAQTLAAGLVLAPFALVGAALGVIGHRWVPERAFFAITYTLLTVAGSKLIWDALG